MNNAIAFLNAKIEEKGAEIHGLNWALQQAEDMDDAAAIADLTKEITYIETEMYALTETRHELEQIAGVEQVVTERVERFMEKGAVA